MKKLIKNSIKSLFLFLLFPSLSFALTPVYKHTNVDLPIPSPSPIILLWAILTVIFIHMATASIFIRVKKLSWKILAGVLIGDIVSTLFVWICTVLTRQLFISEIIAVIFGAAMMKAFSKGTLSWQGALIISVIMNAASFLVGGVLFPIY